MIGSQMMRTTANGHQLCKFPGQIPQGFSRFSIRRRRFNRRRQGACDHEAKPQLTVRVTQVESQVEQAAKGRLTEKSWPSADALQLWRGQHTATSNDGEHNFLLSSSLEGIHDRNDDDRYCIMQTIDKPKSPHPLV